MLLSFESSTQIFFYFFSFGKSRSFFSTCSCLLYFIYIFIYICHERQAVLYLLLFPAKSACRLHRDFLFLPPLYLFFSFSVCVLCPNSRHGHSSTFPDGPSSTIPDGSSSISKKDFLTSVVSPDHEYSLSSARKSEMPTL